MHHCIAVGRFLSVCVKTSVVLKRDDRYIIPDDLSSKMHFEFEQREIYNIVNARKRGRGYLNKNFLSLFLCVYSRMLSTSAIQQAFSSLSPQLLKLIFQKAPESIINFLFVCFHAIILSYLHLGF